MTTYTVRGVSNFLSNNRQEKLYAGRTADQYLARLRLQVLLSAILMFQEPDKERLSMIAEKMGQLVQNDEQFEQLTQRLLESFPGLELECILSPRVLPEIIMPALEELLEIDFSLSEATI